jgi:DNA-directed RNA polymerase specialized sigma24 family protein
VVEEGAKKHLSSNRQFVDTPSKKWALTQEAFDALLAWLDPEREQAGKRYEDIRNRLIKIFACRACHEPEDLADEAINRVAKRVGEIARTYSGDPALYFYGVGNNVHLEYLRKRMPQLAMPPAPSPDEFEQEYECLDRCMSRLPDDSRELVLQYYQEEKKARIEHRKVLAEKWGIALNALRIRAHRIRTTLRQCVQDCLVQHTAV